MCSRCNFNPNVREDLPPVHMPNGDLIYKILKEKSKQIMDEWDRQDMIEREKYVD